MNSNRFKYSSTWVHLSKLFKLKHETNNSLKLSHLSVNLLSHPLQQLKINQPTPPKKLYSSNPPPQKKKLFTPQKNKKPAHNRCPHDFTERSPTVSHDDSSDRRRHSVAAPTLRGDLDAPGFSPHDGSRLWEWIDGWQVDGWVGKVGWDGGLEPPVLVVLRFQKSN